VIIYGQKQGEKTPHLTKVSAGWPELNQLPTYRIPVYRGYSEGDGDHDDGQTYVLLNKVMTDCVFIRLQVLVDRLTGDDDQLKELYNADFDRNNGTKVPSSYQPIYLWNDSGKTSTKDCPPNTWVAKEPRSPATTKSLLVDQFIIYCSTARSSFRYKPCVTLILLHRLGP
jgi:hypothetical protein